MTAKLKLNWMLLTLMDHSENLDCVKTFYSVCILLFKGIKRESFPKLKIHPCAICGDVLKSLWAVTEGK